MALLHSVNEGQGFRTVPGKNECDGTFLLLAHIVVDPISRKVSCRTFHANSTKAPTQSLPRNPCKLEVLEAIYAA